MKLLTMARDLQRRKAREKHQRFVAEGVRTVEALLDSPLQVVGLLVTASFGREPRGGALLARASFFGLDVREVSDQEFATAADTDAPQGVLAIGEMPQRTLDTPPAVSRYLVLDALQDPGNVGTVLRTAAALGITATLALPGTVDLWNAKVVRSTMGALFTHLTLACTVDMLSTMLRTHDMACWAADLGGVDVNDVVRAELPARLALIVSNEGAGLSAEVAALAEQRVAIRMSPGVESLNVAVATGILLHALRPV